MEINYFVVGLVTLAAIALIIFVISRNQKDLKEYKKELINSELKPERHEGE
ncbi:hypothetical protein [Mucilaginibacter sp. SP1R1]|uniref:hypothetical protein n=1 Tax=Mucilaginibacter sp. SP1R1 TaxID=2723091 RepID=UPI001608EC20|nr:hypothetical protein [Mucilaginibacter sp. SP1R1]MBB6148178.1 preprotein translocase subunit YajC [Mucilaginibacter sp. SP1R1]